MPRSIQQLKHRHIQLETVPAGHLVSAVRLLERLPGVNAVADIARHRIAVDYWVDEYTLSELEMELVNAGYPLESGFRNRILSAEIQRDEEDERDRIDYRPLHCHASGVFAHTCYLRHDDYEALPS